ncbi:unnamed protein product [Camellia sinensis]
MLSAVILTRGRIILHLEFGKPWCWKKWNRMELDQDSVKSDGAKLKVLMLNAPYIGSENVIHKAVIHAL